MRIGINLIAVICAAILLSGCEGKHLQVVADFANTQQFDTGTPLYFEDQVIGEVTDVQLGEHGARITLSIVPEAAGQLSSSSAVVVNRLKAGAPLEIYNRNSRGTDLLQDGQTIRGLDSMVQLGAWMLGDAIQLGSGSLSEYVQSFQEYLSSEDFAADKAAVVQQFESARESANSALTQLGTELEMTAEQLANSEQAAAEAMQELGQELAPVVEELAGDGARLADELRRFAESLERQTADERQAGEAFLASLLTTLERLNEAFEKGASASNEDSPSVSQDEPHEQPQLPERE